MTPCEMGRHWFLPVEGYELSSVLADPLSSERCTDCKGKARGKGTSEEGMDYSRGEKAGPRQSGSQGWIL